MIIGELRPGDIFHWWGAGNFPFTVLSIRHEPSGLSPTHCIVRYTVLTWECRIVESTANADYSHIMRIAP